MSCNLQANIYTKKDIEDMFCLLTKYQQEHCDTRLENNNYVGMKIDWTDPNILKKINQLWETIMAHECPKDNIRSLCGPYGIDQLKKIFGSLFYWEHSGRSRIEYTKYKVFNLDYARKILKVSVDMYNDIYIKDQNPIQYIYDKDFTLFKDKKNVNNLKKKVFIQKIIVKKNSKILVIGDIHSSIHSLLFDIIKMHEAGHFIKNTLELKGDRYLIFTGDIIDRGPYSLECLVIILLLKNLNKERVFIINGNHEDHQLNLGLFGEENANKFIDELVKESQSFPDIFYQHWEILFQYFPSAIYLKYESNDKWIHFSHGAFDYNYCIKPDGGESNLKKFLKSDKKYEVVNEEDPDKTQYKWGDFYQETHIDKYIYNNKTNSYEYILGKDRNTGREKFYYNNIETYLLDNNILGMITGHQDIVPFNYVFKKTLVQPIIKTYGQPIIIKTYDAINDKEIFSKYCKGKCEENNYYDLCFINDDFSKNNEFNFKLGTEILACVTSTCYQSKILGLTNSCYLCISFSTLN